MEKWDIGDREQGPLDVGFEKVALYPPPGTHEVEMATGGGEKYIGVDGSYLTEVQGDAVVEFIDRHADGKEPFFLYFTPLAVHSPLVEVPEKYLERVPDDVLKRGGRKDGKPTDVNYRRYLAATIIALDDQIGRMTERLRRHGIERETFVVLTSDNGGNLFDGARPDPYRGGKFGPNTQWAGYLRMPAILSWPGALPEGAVFDGLASTLDLYPTFCAAAKAVPPEPLDGVDLLPVLTGQTEPDPDRALVWELRLGGLTLGPRNNVLRSVVRGDWRLVKFNESGWRLYDLDEDPAEREDLASRYPDVVRQLRQVFADWRSAMADPLRLEWRPGGPVPYGFDGWMTVGEWQEVKDEPRLWKENPVRWRYLNAPKERN
jgi:arylsulfatase A-like enzyme